MQTARNGPDTTSATSTLVPSVSTGITNNAMEFKVYSTIFGLYRSKLSHAVPARSIQQMRARANAVLHLAVLCCAAAFARATEAGEEDLPARDPRKVDDKEIVTAAKVCFTSALVHALFGSAVMLISVANTRSPALPQCTIYFFNHPLSQ